MICLLFLLLICKTLAFSNEVKVASEIIEKIVGGKEIQFCSLIYKELDNLEVKYLMERLPNVVFKYGDIQKMFKDRNINEERDTSDCKLHVSRTLTEEDLQVAAHFIPLAKFIVLSEFKRLQNKRNYIQPLITFLVSKSNKNVVQYMNCQSEMVNVWTERTGFSLPLETMFEICPKGRELIKNQNFVGYGYGYAPYFTKNEFDEFDGMDVLVLKLLADHFSFNLDVRRSAGWDKVIDGKWTNGTIGQVYHGNSQFGVGSLAFTTKRYAAVDYTHYTFFCGVRFFMRKPGPVNPYMKALQPIDYFGWIGFVSFSVLMGLLLIFITWTHPTLDKTPKSFDTVLGSKVVKLIFITHLKIF